LLGSPDILQPLLADARCSFVHGDMMRLHEVHDAFADSDGVFCVAALMASSIAKDPWTGLDVNVRGVMNASRAVLPQMVKRRSGKILAVSCGGATAPRPGFAVFH